MFRRTLFGLLPTFLALAFLCGTPAAGQSNAGVTTWSADSAPSLITRGKLAQEIPDSAIAERADQDDTPDDRVVPPSTAIVWPDRALGTVSLRSSDFIGSSHRPCAARPRAPPAV